MNPFLLRALRVFAVNLSFFFFFCLVLTGCGVLFVEKGELRHLKSPVQEAPTAVTLDKELSKTPVLEYKTVEGDTLEDVAEWYFGDRKKASRVAKDNGLAAGGKPKPGTLLKIVDPVHFPSPKELEAKHKPTPTPKPQKETAKARTPTPTPTPPSLSGKFAKVPRPKRNGAFAAGERLKFEIRALGVLGGYATLEVEKYKTVAGRPCYPLTARANAVFPLSAVFPVNDVQTSYFDAVDFVTWRFENKVHEGNYKARNREDYDQLKHRMVRKHNDDQPVTMDVQPFTQDIISCFYYSRLLPLEMGKTYAIPTQSGGKNYQLYVEVLGKERVKVPAGTFDCLKVKPLVKSATVFRNEEDIDIWLTDDERRVPVRVKSGIVIGSIDVSLLEAALPPLDGK